MRKLKIAAVIALAGLLSATSGPKAWTMIHTVPVGSGLSLPPNPNGANPQYRCDGGTGICMHDEESTCDQYYSDANNDGVFSGGDRVRCRNHGTAAW